MEHNSLLIAEIDILALLMVACLTAIALTRLQFPYTVGLVVIGIILGGLGRSVESLEFLQTLTLSHDLILFVFVPPLIFESAINLDSRLLFRNIIPILTLAAPGLLISTAIVGAILSWGTPLTIAQALLFGSLISATDPVAVIALFKELGAPKQLAVLVEGESLFNDATAIVAFNIILGLILSGAGFSAVTVQQGTVDFLVNFIGGIAVGAGVGWLARYPMALAKDNALVLATISTVLAYSSFLLADEAVGVSGVIALVTAGIMTGWFKANGLSPETRQFVGEFWEYAAFLANSLIFLLVGITLADFQFFAQVGQTQSLSIALVITLGAVLLSRAIVIFGLIPFVNLFRRDNPIERRYQVVSYWGGLRGAVCLALALSLAPNFPNRDLIVFLTLGVAIFTLLIPGTTIAPLMQRLALDRPSILDQFDEQVAKLLSTQEALERVTVLETSVVLSDPAVVAAYRQSYEQEYAANREALKNFLERNPLDDATLQELVWLEALAIEKQMHRRLYDRGFLSATLLSQFNLLVNLRQDAVLVEQIPPPFTGQVTLEIKLKRFALRIGEAIAPNRPWVPGLRTSINEAMGAYWIVTHYIAKVLPDRLRNFFAATGLDPAILQPCLDAYDSQRTQAIARLQEIEQANPGIMATFQRQAGDRIGRFAQQEAVETLVDDGNITEGVARRVLQTLEPG